MTIDPSKLARVAVDGLRLRGEERKRKARRFLRDLIAAALEAAEGEGSQVIGFKVDQEWEEEEYQE